MVNRQHSYAIILDNKMDGEWKFSEDRSTYLSSNFEEIVPERRLRPSMFDLLLP